MALDILTASQGGNCVIIQTKCCVYIPQSSNVMHLTTHMKNQISVLDDPLPRFGDIFFRKMIWFREGNRQEV